MRCVLQDEGLLAQMQHKADYKSWLIHSVWSLIWRWNPDERLTVLISQVIIAMIQKGGRMVSGLWWREKLADPQNHWNSLRDAGFGHLDTTQILSESALSCPFSVMYPNKLTELIWNSHISALTKSLFSRSHWRTCRHEKCALRGFGRRSRYCLNIGRKSSWWSPKGHCLSGPGWLLGHWSCWRAL